MSELLLDDSTTDLLTSWAPPVATSAPAPSAAEASAFPPPPPEPESLEKAGLTADEVESLVLKTLLLSGASSGAAVANQVCLPRTLVGATLSQLRDELLVSIKTAAGMNDFIFQLSEAGFARARQHHQRSSYCGAAPVPLAVYDRAIRRQAISQTKLSLPQLQRALADMTLRPEFVSLIAQAINDGRGMFLYGSPGNGKTTIAERICEAFGQTIWIPRMIGVGGDMLRLYDPSCHHAVEPPQLAATRHDRRWVLIRRPTVVVGGELTLEQLDPRYSAASGISEAPVQMKAGGGVLVIDDFGRQRVSSTEILNRLIVPLEKQFDFLSLASGRQIQTPFELLFVLSTNLEPKQLVDEAFLRRIPYKIEVHNPTEDQFREVFRKEAQKLQYQVEPGALDYLIAEHYSDLSRPLRFCQPRDLMRQVKNYCEVLGRPKAVDRHTLDIAVRNYFVGI